MGRTVGASWVVGGTSRELEVETIDGYIGIDFFFRNTYEVAYYK